METHILSTEELAEAYGCSPRNARKMRARCDERYDLVQMGSYLKLHGFTPAMIPAIVEMFEKVKACQKQ
jgi:hypothetical protein